MQSDQSLTDLLETTYDRCFDDCRAAVSLEDKEHITEADRYWKATIRRIQEFRKSLPEANIFQSEAGKDAIKGLRDLELTAQEHLDLHEGLRLSLQSFSIQDSTPTESPPGPSGECKRASFEELPTPQAPPPFPLPPRPPLPPRISSSSEHGAVASSVSVGSSDSGQSRQNVDISPFLNMPPAKTSPGPAANRSPNRTSRSSSPSTHRFRRTLRTGKPSFRPKDQTATAPGADRAAAAAWVARDSRSSTERVNSHSSSRSGGIDNNVANRNIMSSRSPASPVVQPSPPMAQQSDPFSMRYDRHTRRLIPRNASASAAASSKKDGKRTALALDSTRHTSASAAVSRHPAEKIPSRTTTPLQDTSRSSWHGGLEASGVGSGSSRKESRLREIPLEVGVDGSGGASMRTRSDKTQRSPATPDFEGESGHAPLAAQAEAEADTEEGAETKDMNVEAVWDRKRARVLKKLPSTVDKDTAANILDEIDPNKDVIHWRDIAGLEEAKNALKEAVVYPFLRPDLFRGLREPPKGILLFGPPGTGKTMLARAVATESESAYIAVTASTLNSKYLGESEKHVRALFTVAKMLAPSIIFVDEVDSILSQRSSSGEHEASRRLKTEFLIQWSSLEKSAAVAAGGAGNHIKRLADNRVLVLAATNRPWDLDDAATRRFARRQYIPLPEAETRRVQLRTLLESEHKHCLSEADVDELVRLTDGYSGSDITHLARQASYGPLRSHGEAVLHMTPEEIRPVEVSDFVACLRTVRPSVNQRSLKQFEDWAKQFGETIG